MKRDLTIFLVGMSHKSAPVDVREKMGIGQESIEKFLKGLAAWPGITKAISVVLAARKALPYSNLKAVSGVGLKISAARGLKASPSWLNGPVTQGSAEQSVSFPLMEKLS